MSNLLVGTPALTASAANASSFVLRSFAGDVDFFVFNSGATAGWLMLHDLSAAPVNGAVTPRLVWQIPANTTLDRGFDPPLRVVNGAVLTFSTTGPTTLTLSATGWFGGRIV